MTADQSLFPPSKRVIYGRAPLAEVICQVRYPSLLRIEAEPPAAFQEAVRGRFPYYEVARKSLPDQLPPEILKLLSGTAAKSDHVFASDDRQTTITLGIDALSLTTRAYTCWEDFRRDLSLALDALAANYKPAFYTRVGLRYLNVIIRSELGLQGVPWSELLQPSIAGELTLPGWEPHVQEFQNTIRCNLPEGGAFLLQHGYGNRIGSTEQGYIIDFDFYNDAKTEVNDGLATANALNQHSGSAFRACISPALHDKLEPHDL